MSLKTNKEIEIILNNDNSKRQEYLNYFNFRQSVKEFTNKCTKNTFIKLFNNDSERLWDNYINKCNKDFDNFLTYLTNSQKNELIYNIHESKNYLY